MRILILLLLSTILLDCSNENPDAQRQSPPPKVTPRVQSVVKQESRSKSSSPVRSKVDTIADREPPAYSVEKVESRPSDLASVSPAISANSSVSDRPKIKNISDSFPSATSSTKSNSNSNNSTFIPTSSGQLTHSSWDAMLQQYVNTRGDVNYTAWKEDMSELNKYLELLAQNPPVSNWSRSKSLSYWINVYNAFTVKMILDHYPVSSITDIHHGKPWDKKWILLGKELFSLNEIENEIIRPRYQEPRIHFAINCAAKSCPPLHNRAFTERNLNTQLEQLTISFINDVEYNVITSEQANISKIFDWYSKDFGNLQNYLNRYVKTDLSDSLEIKYLPYDWRLNAQ